MQLQHGLHPRQRVINIGGRGGRGGDAPSLQHEGWPALGHVHPTPQGGDGRLQCIDHAGDVPRPQLRILQGRDIEDPAVFRVVVGITCRLLPLGSEVQDEAVGGHRQAYSVLDQSQTPHPVRGMSEGTPGGSNALTGLHRQPFGVKAATHCCVLEYEDPLQGEEDSFTAALSGWGQCEIHLAVQSHMASDAWGSARLGCMVHWHGMA